MSSRNTRSRKPPGASSSTSAPRSSRPWAPPTTNADKERLQHQYGALFDEVAILKDAVVAAERSEQRAAGGLFDEGLVCSCPIVLPPLLTYL
jgi:hypothetical protein